MDDGQFELLVVEKITRRALITAFVKIYKGTHTSHRCVKMLHGRRLSVATERELPLLFDGDVVGTTPLDVEIVPRALRVVR